MQTRSGCGFTSARRARHRPSLTRLRAVFAILVLCVSAGTVWSRDREVAFDVAAAPLDRALAEFARQSDSQLLYAPALVRGRRAVAVSGRMPPREALTRLLARSGLVAEPVPGGTFVLRARTAEPVATSPPPSPPRSEAPVSPPVLRRVLVTGSRIPRAGLETTLPVTVVDREQIELGGFTTLFDLLRHQPGMSGHHAVEAATEDISQSLTSLVPNAVAQSASLYGLGPRGTLYLIDGRRVANYALPSTNLGGLTDLGAIPLSMVERVEILRGGASAIYGADAVAGVVNIVLKQDYRGGEASVLYGLSERGDAETTRVSASAGFGLGSGQVSVFADRFSQAHLPGTARRWHTRDRRAEGLEDATYPLGYYTVEGPDFFQRFGRCTASGDERDPACRLDRERYRSLRPASDGTSLGLRWTHPLHAETDAELYADVRTSELRTRMESAPSAYTMRVPLHDPMRDRAYAVYRAFYDVGQVSSRSRATSLDATLGMRLPVGTWSLETDVSRSSNRVENLTRGIVNAAVLNEAIDARAYHFDGTPNDPDVVRGLAPVLQTRGRGTSETVSVRGSGPLLQWRGGTVLAAAGAETRRETLDYRPDPYFGTPDFGAPTDVDPRRGTSRRHAVFGEVQIPFSDRLWMEVAGRLDRADAHGSELSPRLGLGWRPATSLLLRASTAESFRAPTLYETLARPPPDEYFGAVASSFDASVVASCAQVHDGACDLPIGVASNPSLKPEHARTHTVGLVWSPLAGLDLTLDYFNVIRSNEIAVAGAVVDNVARIASLKRDEHGLATGLASRYLNTARTDVHGAHLDADWTSETAMGHRWGVRVAGHYLQSVRVAAADGPSSEQAGHLSPRFAANTSLQWRAGDWSAALHLRHFGGYRVHRAEAPCPAMHVDAGRCMNPSVNLLAAHVARDLGDAWRISADVNNLADRRPANYDVDRAGYNGAIDDLIGRQYLLRVRYRF